MFTSPAPWLALALGLAMTCARAVPPADPTPPGPGELPATAGAPCMRTGCSGQLCADHELVSTCEMRPEYECYRRASCERQPDGTCGFTPSPELEACLRSPPPSGSGADVPQ